VRLKLYSTCSANSNPSPTEEGRKEGIKEGRKEGRREGGK
jgi:hypothetical protein